MSSQDHSLPSPIATDEIVETKALAVLRWYIQQVDTAKRYPHHIIDIRRFEQNARDVLRLADTTPKIQSVR